MGLLDSRATTLKLEVMGQWYGGICIAEPEETQRTEYVKGGGGAPLYWMDKKPVPGVAHDPRTGQPNEPVLQTEIILDTDTEDEYGSKERTLYIDNKRKTVAFRNAWRKAGMPRGSSLVGCRVMAQWVGTEPGEGTQEAKLYAYHITPPVDGPRRIQSAVSGASNTVTYHITPPAPVAPTADPPGWSGNGQTYSPPPDPRPTNPPPSAQTYAPPPPPPGLFADEPPL